jgi:hypothetical protein
MPQAVMDRHIRIDGQLLLVPGLISVRLVPAASYHSTVRPALDWVGTGPQTLDLRHAPPVTWPRIGWTDRFGLELPVIFSDIAAVCSSPLISCHVRLQQRTRSIPSSLATSFSYIQQGTEPIAHQRPAFVGHINPQVTSPPATPSLQYTLPAVLATHHTPPAYLNITTIAYQDESRLSPSLGDLDAGDRRLQHAAHKVPGRFIQHWECGRYKDDVLI